MPSSHRAPGYPHPRLSTTPTRRADAPGGCEYYRGMHIVIIGGGPGGYEAALVAAELGAQVTVVSDEGLGGNCVLWDCVPSKTLLSSAQAFSVLETAPALGVHFQGVPRRAV